MMYKPSRLFHLSPKEIETPLTEAITSLIVRLAAEHHLLVYMLLKEIIVPLLGKAYLHNENGAIPHRLSAKWFRQTATQITGVNQSTQEWIEILETLTQHQDLRYLTMIVWADTIAYRGLIRSFQAWCPFCYEWMRQSDGEVYNPLAWSLKDNESCLLHQLLLQEKCPYPDCQKQFSLLISKGCIGYCPACFRWLGNLSIYSDFIEADTNQLRHSQMIGELISAAPNLPFQPKSKIFAETIRKLIESLFDGNAKAFARFAEVNHKTVYLWRNDKQIPQLKTLLRLCTKLGVSPLKLLSGYLLDPASQLPVMISARVSQPIKTKKQYRVFNREAIQQQLKEIFTTEFPPRPMHKIAKSLGYDHSFLIRKFPRLCRQISRKFLTYVEQQRQLKHNINKEDLEAAMLKLHAEAQFPSHRRLRKEFGGKMRSPILRIIRKQVLRELNYL